MEQYQNLKKMNIGDEIRQSIKLAFTKHNEIALNDALKTLYCLIKNEIENNYRAIIIEFESDSNDFFTYEELHKINPIFAAFFGKLMVQNEQGHKVICVYDRDREDSMLQGARYHQTREGGSIHTDNVNIPELWQYLYLSCIAPAFVGGESILVDGLQVYHELKNKHSNALAILEANFIWEMRGIADSLYNAPIISYNHKNEPQFRHLRPYMESAHRKANEPLTKLQLYALDVLDAITNNSEFQIRYRMKKGDLVLSKDAQVLHGRTCFSDEISAVSFDDYLNGQGRIMKRTMERVWIQL